MVLSSILFLTQAVAPKPFVICIDPGHPSENGSGAVGKGINELELAWQVSLETAEILQQWDPTVKIVFTKRTLKEKVTNKRRAEIANESHADLCLRVHADSGGRSGFATYYPDKQAKVQGVFGPPTEVISTSQDLARVFHVHAMEVLKSDLPDLGCLSEQKTMIGGKQGALTGTVFSKVPVFLVELCAVDNAHDAKFAKTQAGVRQFAYALANGVYFALGMKKATQSSAR